MYIQDGPSTAILANVLMENNKADRVGLSIKLHLLCE
jgi:hypothetical protein